jgi:hypothetical protein
MRTLLVIARGHPVALMESLIDRIDIADAQHADLPHLAALLHPSLNEGVDANRARYVVRINPQESNRLPLIFRVDDLIGWENDLVAVPLPLFAGQDWIADAIGIVPVQEKLPLFIGYRTSR